MEALAPQAFVAAVLVGYLVFLRATAGKPAEASVEVGPSLATPPPVNSLAVANGPAPSATHLVAGGRLFGAFVLAARVGETCLIAEEAKRPAFAVATVAALASLALWVAGDATFSRVLLGTHSGQNEQLSKGNEAVALAKAGHAVGTALVVAGSISGTSYAELATSLPFAVLGLVAVQCAIILFRALTVYDDSSQIASGNVAAAVSYAGLTIAVSIVVADAVDGDFTTWKEALSDFGKSLAPALAIFPVRQLFVQGLLLGKRPTLRGGYLDEAVGGERAVGVAALEAASYVGAVLFTAALP